MKEPKTYILHILDAISTIEGYIQGFSYDQFCEDQRTHDAVIRQLEIIGEAAGQLEEQFKLSHPNLPWQLMKDMRNKLIHEYFDVDLVIVWETVRRGLPELRTKLQLIYPKR